MRRKPVRRDEVRFDGRRITTLPIDTVLENDWGRFVPIARGCGSRCCARSTGLGSGTGTGMPRRVSRRARPASGVSSSHARSLPQHPYRVFGPCTCRHCGAGFYRAGHSNSRHCSDECALESARAGRSRVNATMVRERSEARAAARAGLVCIICGEPIEAARSTRRTCSDRCRTVAHRLAKAGQLT